MKKKLTAVALVVCMLAIMLVGASLAYFTDTDEATNTFTMGKVDIMLTEPEWTKNNPNGIAKLMPGTVIDKDPTITVAQNSEDAYLFLDVIFNKYNSLFWVMAADASADKEINFTIFNNDGSVNADFKNDAEQFSTSKFMAAMKKPENKAVFQQIVNKWFGGINHTDWEIRVDDMGKLNESCFTLRLAYIGGEKGGVVSAGEAVKFMEKFGMPGSVTQEMIDAGVTVGGQKSTFNTDKANFKLTFKAYAIQSAELTLDDAYTALFNK